MMRHLSLPEILELHEALISSSGGLRGIRDIRALESAINEPRLTFDQNDLYPDLISKAAALCFFLVMNHPFVDGNKRIGHAAMEAFQGDAFACFIQFSPEDIIFTRLNMRCGRTSTSPS
ncbi:MAG: Fic family protein [Pseudomonadota bacterium]